MQHELRLKDQTTYHVQHNQRHSYDENKNEIHILERSTRTAQGKNNIFCSDKERNLYTVGPNEENKALCTQVRYVGVVVSVLATGSKGCRFKTRPR
jgi:hypothetical protein